MDTDFQSPQRIARLTPLADVLAMIEAQVKPAAPRDVPIAEAAGFTLAQDIRISQDTPSRPIALRDGFAVSAELTLDASAYAPIPLTQMPLRIDAGERMPSNTDAVAPLDAVMIQNGSAQLVSSVAPGEGVLLAGGDASAGAVLGGNCQRLSQSDILALEVCGVTAVTVRVPRVCVIDAKKTKSATVRWIKAAVGAAGAIANDTDFDLALKIDADAFIVIGGTGTGREDDSIRKIAGIGRVLVHGIGLMPGETTAFGIIGDRPALMPPGGNAAIAAWLMIGCPLIAKLCGRKGDDNGAQGILARKVTSTIGIVDVVLVRRDDDRVEPLASGYWPMQAIADADGFIVVPAQSEGYPEGSAVSVKALP